MLTSKQKRMQQQKGTPHKFTWYVALRLSPIASMADPICSIVDRLDPFVLLGKTRAFRLKFPLALARNFFFC
jgi:hypothetical protein